MRKVIKDSAGFVDSIEFVHRDKNGNIIRKWNNNGISYFRKLVNFLLNRHNSITNDGFAIIAGLVIADVGETAFDFMQIGTGTTGAQATDIKLESPKGVRQPTTGTRVTTTVTNDTAQWVVTFSQALDATLTGTNVITEYGIFNHVSADNKMLLRIVSGSENMNWDAGDTLQVTIKCQMKQG